MRQRRTFAAQIGSWRGPRSHRFLDRIVLLLSNPFDAVCEHLRGRVADDLIVPGKLVEVGQRSAPFRLDMGCFGVFPRELFDDIDVFPEGNGDEFDFTIDDAAQEICTPASRNTFQVLHDAGGKVALVVRSFLVRRPGVPSACDHVIFLVFHTFMCSFASLSCVFRRAVSPSVPITSLQGIGYWRKLQGDRFVGNRLSAALERVSWRCCGR